MKGRTRLVWRTELAHQSTRPLLWILVVLLGVTAWGLSIGDVRISSGDSSVGGTKAWITSEFNNSKLFALTIFIFYSLFLAVAAGMMVIQDDELKVGEIQHATPLRPGEYLWGKFLAVLAAFLAILGLHLLFTMFFNHVLPNPKAVEVRGPFGLMNYLRPALVFGIPPMIFIAGTTFAIGERTRKPILVFFLPVAAVLLCAFFLWSWSPSWLSPGLNRLLMWLDPAGLRWISETWLKVDRGVEFYNHDPVRFDLPFLLSRLVFVGLGLGAVVLGQRHFASNLRGSHERVRGRVEAAAAVERTADATAGAGLPQMKVSAPGLLAGIWQVLRFELQELRNQPGLYLFVPLILLQTLGTCLTAIGAMDTSVLITSGTVAVRAMNTLTLLICFLTLFYTVESMRRERNTGLAAVYYATATRTSSILFGKVLANSVVGIVIVLAAFLGSAIAILIQGQVALDLRPFLLVWGVLLVPTIVVWTSFVMFLFALTNNRYTTYGLGLAAMALTGLLQMLGKMSWVGNWDLWSALRWTDMGSFELDRTALLLNRIAVLGLALFFTALTVRIFPRRDRDATRMVHRLGAGSLLRSALRLSPYAVVPIVALAALWMQVNQGFQGKAQEKLGKDYWKQNLATWKDAPLPALRHVDLDLSLTPSRRAFRMQGSYLLVNRTDKPLAQVPLTGAAHWEEVSWTLGDSTYKPEDRSRLFVFTPPAPLAPGDSLRIGFRYHGRFPNGVSKNGGGTEEFILPSGVVLTSFRPSFVPILGYVEEIGVNKDNKYEPKVYSDDFYEGITPPAFGTGVPFTTRIRITAPEAYTLNAVGTKMEETVEKGLRTAIWESDQPVRFFNVVAGRWKEKRGEGTVVNYHSRHTYNIEEISQGLDAARRYYSEWFLPYPWRELKLSEFPSLSFYAQGFPTNISFSEGIGFLTKNSAKTNATFMVTAHESAHQWWGNILTPGKGPGGEILSEGMANFSTILLMEQSKGLQARIEFCKRIEEQYGDDRQVDSERPLVKIDGSRTGDETVMYDKGAWVFWMLLNRMGREQTLAGMRSFVEAYKDGPDYPVLQDFVEGMRPFAPDSAGYEDYVQQWFFQLVMPEYKLSEAKRTEGNAELAPSGDSALAAAGTWTVTAKLRNAGTGRMPVEIAAVAGERFPKGGETSTNYREARTTLTLGAGEEQEFSIPCAFKPERLIVDPDALVLQLMRKAALAGL